ncbi:MAG: response regulator [Candidatus Latescibacteria bacterium]|nr:response regulator [Candidatus Latescibacterota bacterium]MBT4139146.1 response regulator [Candidatus Latescibacterota bacterium]MBT5832876.1 response regulator [Candidatus Latescibacterota bacterium]
MQQTRTILTIDDDPEVLEAVGEFLHAHEYRVVTAQRWTEAIAQLTDVRPDAVLLDLHMPTVRGEALLEFIRENYAQLPVVIISAGATPAEMARLGELGANGFIRKPFDTEDLIVILEQVLLDLETSATTAPIPPAPDIDVPALPQLEHKEKLEEDTDEETEDDEPLLKTQQAERAQLPPGISPGSGIQNLTSMQPQPQQQEVRRRRKKKRAGGRKVTRLRKIRNYAAIILLFVGLGYVIYLSQKGFSTNFIGGITFGEQKAE